MELSQSDSTYQFVDIRQRQFRDFQLWLKRLQPEEWAEEIDLPINLYFDKLCAAAIKAGWLEDPPDVDEMYPKEISELGTAIAKIYGELIAPDPN